MKLDILDCTLRDGGYYCNWDYPDGLVERYLDAVSAAGVRYVEIGFRTTQKTGFMGRYRFSRDTHLAPLFAGRAVRPVVMVETKEFTREGGGLDEDGLHSCFGPRSESPVEMVRIATTLSLMPQTVQMAGILHDLGYSVSVNLMQASLLTEKALIEAAGALEASEAQIVYLADSFGGLTPKETLRLFAVLRASFTRRIGFHSHDNLGLALSNTLAAIEAGADIVDASLLGMGRGAGNLRTEQLLFYLRGKAGFTEVDPAPLFDIVSNEFEQFHRKYGWGMNLAYMLSGVYNVHPTYAQQLLQGRRYSSMEVVRVLEAIHASGEGTAFRPEQLSRSLGARFVSAKDRVPVAALKGYRNGLPPPGEAAGRPVLILGSGPSAGERARDINAFIRAHEPIVLECNYQASIEDSPLHYSVFTNSQRLLEHSEHLPARRSRLLLGMTEVSRETVGAIEGLTVHHYPYRVKAGAFDAEDVCTIPFDVVSMFAFGAALRLRPRTIYLCGFDGYSPAGEPEASTHGFERITMEREMEEFLRILKARPEIGGKQVPIVSLTPTTYDVDKSSLYAFI